MASGFIRAIVWLLIAALGHAPFPSLHCHDLLTGEQLATHLRFHAEHHQHSAASSWHIHLSGLGLTYGYTSDGWGVCDSHEPTFVADDRCESVREELVVPLEACGARACNAFFHVVALPSRCLLCTRSPQDGSHLYELYGSLLL